MPMPPRPKRSAAPKAGRAGAKTPGDSRTTSILEELGIDSALGGGDAGFDSPSSEPLPKAEGKKTPTEKKLYERIERFYRMLGTVLQPFSRFYPPVAPISQNLKKFSEDAADAWIELANEDPKIKKKLEEWTSVSAWGNVVGVHFAIIAGSAIPQGPIEQKQEKPPDTQDVGEVLNFARNMGLNDNEIDQALKLAGFNINGPGDTIRTQQVPIPDVNTVRAQESRIQSPSDLGVTRDGQQQSSPMRTGGIQ